MSTMPETNDPRALLAEALDLPRGEQIPLLERAELAAEASGDMSLLADIRLLLTSAYSFSGHPLRMLRTASWLARQLQQRAPWLDDRLPFHILWCLKWVVPKLAATPTVSRQQVEDFLALMRELYATAGEPLAPVHGSEYLAVRQLDGEQAASAAYDRWVQAPRTRLSDCAACEAHERAQHLVLLGRMDAAVEEGADLIGGRATCAEQPQYGRAMLVLPLLLIGDAERAGAMVRAAWPELRHDPGSLVAVGELVEALALTGNLDRAVEMWMLRASQLQDPPTVEDAMMFAARGARLCRALVEDGRGDLALPTGDGDWAPAADLEGRLATRARDLAAQFDRRNGNGHIGVRVEQVLARPALPPADLSGDGQRPDIAPELRFPRTGLWALAPSASDLAAMDAAAVAALAEDAVRLGSGVDRDRVVRRWLQVDRQQLDPRTRALADEWLHRDPASPRDQELLRAEAEEAWRAAGEESRADALRVEGLVEAGQPVDAMALEARVRERGSALDRAMALLAVLPLVEDPAAFATRAAGLVPELSGTDARERCLRAQLLLVLQQVRRDGEAVDLGLRDGELAALQVAARLNALGVGLSEGVDDEGLARATATVRDLVREAHRSGSLSAWSSALELAAQLHAAGGDAVAAEQCLAAASSADMVRAVPETTLPMLMQHAQMLAGQQRGVEAADTAGRALVLATQLDDGAAGPAARWRRMQALALAGNLEADLGNAERAGVLLGEAEELATALDDRGALMHVHHDLARVRVDADPLAARALLARAVDAAVELDPAEAFGWLLELARVTVGTDGGAAALAELDRAGTLLAGGIEGIHPEYAGWALRRCRAEVLASAGQPAAARQQLEGLSVQLDATGQHRQAMAVQVLDAQLALDLAAPDDRAAVDALADVARRARAEDMPDLAHVALLHAVGWLEEHDRREEADRLAGEGEF